MAPSRSLVARLALCLCCLVLVFGCKKNKAEASSEALAIIPADIQGVYGRTANDAPGMKVTPSGLETPHMKLTIHQGKLEGSTVRVERATLAWAKLEPKTCTGTVSRQGDRLLMSLYELDRGDTRCEPLLDAEWFRWEQATELPKLIQGRYGVVLVEPQRLRLDLEWVEESMKVESLFVLPGTNDVRAELLIDDAKVEAEDGSFECTGTLSFVDNRLETDFWVPAHLEPAEGEEDELEAEALAKLHENRRICDNWDGSATRWNVSLDKLPDAPVSNGETTITVSEQQVVLSSEHLHCEMPLHRTESVASRRWGNAAAGAESMTLGKAAPSSVSDECKLKLRIWCERDEGKVGFDPQVAPSENVLACMDHAEHELCPDKIYMREISDIRYKVGAEPRRFNEIACVNMIGDFVVEG